MLSAGSTCVSCGPGSSLEKAGRGFGAGLGGVGREERGLELLFVWAWRRFGEGLARVWHGFGAAWGCGLGLCFAWALPRRSYIEARPRLRLDGVEAAKERLRKKSKQNMKPLGQAVSYSCFDFSGSLGKVF